VGLIRPCVLQPETASAANKHVAYLVAGLRQSNKI
jgi:hypothetical protein